MCARIITHYPKCLNSVLKDGIGFRPYKEELRLSLDSDLFPQMMTILDVNHVVVFPDRTWMQTTKDSVILSNQTGLKIGL